MVFDIKMPFFWGGGEDEHLISAFLTSTFRATIDEKLSSLFKCFIEKLK